MDAVTAVKLALIILEVVCAWILAGFLSRAIGVRPVRAMLQGAEVLAFMAVTLLPAPRIPGRHTKVRQAVTA